MTRLGRSNYRTGSNTNQALAAQNAEAFTGWSADHLPPMTIIVVFLSPSSQTTP